MQEFLTCRGVVFKIGEEESSFRLKPALNGSDSSPVLLQSVSIENSIIHTPVVCLNNTRILYVFGKNFGDISVGGMAMLGKGGSGKALSKVIQYYEANLTTGDGKKVVKISLPGNKHYKFNLLGMRVSEPNSELQYFPFTLIGKIQE